MKTATKIICLLATSIFAAMGCTHPLKVTNRDVFTPVNAYQRETVKLGFAPTQDRLLRSIISETSLSSSVEAVKKDCHTSAGMDLDYICDLNKTVKYKSSLQNIPIAFPGFLVFSHAWLGYKYYIEVDTDVRVLDPKTGRLINQFNIVTPYEIRYTSFSRGAATSLLGWFAPGWGLCALGAGAVYSQNHDPGITTEFSDKVEYSYRSFVSSKLLERVAQIQATSIARLDSQYEMQPQIIAVK